MCAAGLAVAGQRHEDKHKRPLIDVSPIKAGRKWNHAWAGGATASLPDEYFVSFLGTSCPCCKLWVRVANAMTHSSDLPPVLGVVSARPDKVATFIDEHEIRFPVTVVSESLMARLTRAVPTTAIIRNGYIEEVFTGMLPPEHAGRFREVFFPEMPAADEELATANVS
jgi:hypothetical protein